MSIFLERHAQALLGSLGRLARQPFAACLTVIVIAIALALPAALYLAVSNMRVVTSGLGETVPVDAFESGAAPNNVLQLIGNVWEWTNSDFEVSDDEGRRVFGEMAMKSIRGGAFDTYFELQATSNFRTGQASLGRTHNTGFRCAADLT